MNIPAAHKDKYLDLLYKFRSVISRDNNKLDPVCAVAAEAYFDAYLSGKSEAKANQAAGIAFLDAVANTPSYSPESPCGRSAETYMKSFEL